MSSPHEEKIMTLQGQVEKLQGQKDTLLKELDEVEEKFERNSRLYRKYFPLILDSVAEGDNSFSKVCGDLSAALKKGESEGKIEYIFQRLKTAVINEDAGPSSGKKKGLFASFIKGGSDSFIDDYRQGYQDIVNTLKSTMDKKYLSRLGQITSRINTAEDTDDISDIRESVFNLIFIYISETNQDREKINAFVREIVSKILEIESRVSDTYQQADSIFQISSGFESALSEEMQGLKQTSNVASSLESLKAAVSERLASIDNALKKKQARDHAVREMIDKSRRAFKTGFAKLKTELDEATRHSEDLEKKLNRDQLTGAYNRRAYDNRIQDEMERFLRYKSVFSLLVIDADKFKNINDTYGHSIGDRCLQEIIKRSRPLLRKTDMLARYGGEEFAVIMPETPKEGAEKAAEKIRQTIERIEFIYKKEKVKVTVSIGVTQVKEGDAGHQQVFERADIAVYKAKEAGRNRVVVN